MVVDCGTSLKHTVQDPAMSIKLLPRLVVTIILLSEFLTMICRQSGSACVQGRCKMLLQSGGALAAQQDHELARVESLSLCSGSTIPVPF
jgi:hypothetical protein